VVTTTGSMGDVIGGTERGAGVGAGVGGGADMVRADTPTPRLDGPRNDIPRGGNGDATIYIPRGEVRDLA